MQLARPGGIRHAYGGTSKALALNSAGLAEQKTLYDAAGIDRGTAEAYERLLISLLVLDLVPAWLTNRLSRLVKSPRRYLVDPSLIGAALRLDVAAVMRDGDILGRMLGTLVTAQLRPELALSRARPRLYHVREKNGRREIDLLIELGAHRVVALKVKATAAPATDACPDRAGYVHQSRAVVRRGVPVRPFAQDSHRGAVR